MSPAPRNPLSVRVAVGVALTLVLASCSNAEPADRRARAPSPTDDAGGIDTALADASKTAMPPDGRPTLDGNTDAAPAPRLARNVIILMGDGMGPKHLDAARAAAGGTLALDGLEGPVLYETDSLDAPIVTDSAAAATALGTGQCTHNGFLAVNAAGDPLDTTLELAQREGKRVGLVTNTVILDASPMAFATHVDCRFCFDDVARSLFEQSRPNLVMGGDMPGAAFTDGVSLFDRAVAAGYHATVDLTAIANGTAADGPWLGLFGQGPSHIQWPEWEWGLTPETWRPVDSAEPTLAEMTRVALDTLQGSGGLFLFVEDEHPDTIGHAAHLDVPAATLLMPDAVLELDRAVAEAMAWVERESSFEETLLVVCADHETGGYLPDNVEPSLTTFPASPDHTRTPVAAFARGPGSERLASVQHISDLYRLMTGTLRPSPSAATCP